MREAPRIAEERLWTCLREQYGLQPVSVTYLPLGKDYHAGVFRVVDEQGTAYLLKATTRPLYEPSCVIPHSLNAHGVEAVVAPIYTQDQALWTTVGEGGAEWTVLVYPWIEGTSGWAGMTDALWREVGVIFQRIHAIPFSSAWLDGYSSIRQETFDPTVYLQWIRTFEAQHLDAPTNDSPSARSVHSLWAEHRAVIQTMARSLETLGALLRAQRLPSVICHADLHAANLIRDAAGRVFVIDWDEVMLAPKERDFIFIREPDANGFWEGYGRRDINWTALTYYLWERTVQDLIECAKDVCLRDDLGEETKAEIAELFRIILTEPDSSLGAAYGAASHLA